MYFAWTATKTEINSLHRVNCLVCIDEEEGVYCAVGVESLYVIQVKFSL